MRIRKTGLAVLVALLSVGVSGCGDVGSPVDLAKVDDAERPLPQGAGPAKPDSDGPEPNCGDPTASLRPSGTAVPPGSTMAEIKKRGHLIAGVDQNSYLSGFRDPRTGDLDGFDIDIAKEIARSLFGDPSRIQFRALTSAERVPALQRGEVDIVVRTMSITCSRWQDISFSTEYLTAGQRVLVNNNSRARSLGDLRGQKVCSSKGSTSIKKIMSAGAQPMAVENWSDCLVLLQQGQVDAVSTDDTILAGMAAQDPNTRIIGPRFSTEPYGIGVPKDNEDMVRYVNAVLDEIRGNGSWASSYDKWFGRQLGPQSPPAPVYKD